MNKRVQREYDKQANVLGIKRMLKIGMILCLVFALFYFRNYFTLENIKNVVSNIQYSMTGKISTVKVTNFTFSGDKYNQFVKYRDKLVLVGISGVKMFDEEHSSVDSIDLTYQKPMVKSGNKYMLSFDAGGSKVDVVQDAAIKSTIQTSGKVMAAAVNDSGFFAIVSGESGYKGAVTAYDSSLEQLYKFSSPEDILGVDISPTSDAMAVLTVDTSKGEIDSKVTTYKFSSEDALGNYSFPNSLLMEVHYKDSNLLSVMGDTELLLLNAKGEMRAEYPFNGRFLMEYDMEPQKYTALALSENKTATQTAIRCVDNNGELRGEYIVKEEVLDLAANDNMVIVLTGSGIIQLNTKCELVQKLDLNDDAQKVIISKNSVFLIGQTWAKSLALS